VKSDRLSALWNRLASYPPLEVAIELLLIGVVVYSVFRFVRGTRAAGALKGLFLVLVFATVVARVIGAGETFQRLAFLYDRFLAIVAVGLLVIFQPELRRGLIRLGETTLWRQSTSAIAQTVDHLVEACSYFSKSRFGAIIVIQRQLPLRGLVEGGTALGSELSSRLLQTIFFPGTALHDLAVLIKGNTVVAAGVQLPLADPADMPDPRLGSRHRAAVGLTKECDAIVVVVSEETGEIRLAERGFLTGPYKPEGLRDELFQRLRLDIREVHQDEEGSFETSAEPAPAPPSLVADTSTEGRTKEPAA
jgi:diadenylate cyclase